MIVITSAPAGTYFLRMRSVGPGGAGAASNEITIVVSGPGCETPPAPQLTARVIGRQVTLAWQLPAAASNVTSLEIQAGSASGLANVAVVTLDGSQRTFSVLAPPGQYFVRILARNACAAGPASNEVVVTVP